MVWNFFSMVDNNTNLKLLSVINLLSAGDFFFTCAKQFEWLPGLWPVCYLVTWIGEVRPMAIGQAVSVAYVEQHTQAWAPQQFPCSLSSILSLSLSLSSGLLFIHALTHSVDDVTLIAKIMMARSRFANKPISHCLMLIVSISCFSINSSLKRDSETINEIV